MYGEGASEIRFMYGGGEGAVEIAAIEVCAAAGLDGGTDGDDF